MYYGERFNSITHLIGAILALVGLGSLLTIGIQQNEPLIIISFTVFGLTLVLLYTMSTLYHSFHPPELKQIFQKLDHLSIYLLIAGTYTPYMLVSLVDSNGPLMLSVVWGLAATGILLEIYSPKRNESLQIVIYLLMGWVCTLEYSTLKAAITTAGIAWLTAGGIAYTVGIVFYVMDDMNKLRHAHGIWHLFVLIGSICHFISIIGYVR
ncbi:hemolysin III [Methyloprofundus sedimenti]|uniref:Hemolysin III n=1 Tax=Methyloprofundus sedimenti TaxID=1420851 RepID=A0A1V8M6B1_9GAMM|nr:hemolysin III family protein [Methyloprofundus sedimenti]OQK17072.1 hemolysin III [Methyloprofundus sedimenti]